MLFQSDWQGLVSPKHLVLADWLYLKIIILCNMLFICFDTCPVIQHYVHIQHHYIAQFCYFLRLQGFSTGLPERLQLPLLRTLPGLENCSMLRPAYAVEYDYLPAHQCSRYLMTKKIDGLFFSGQINGTTGYEEAALFCGEPA